MVIVLKVPEVIIPVKIGKLQFEVDISDEGLLILAEAADTFDSMTDEDESMKVALKNAFNTILGKGAYKKLYKQTPSNVSLLIIFHRLAEDLLEEIRGGRDGTI